MKVRICPSCGNPLRVQNNINSNSWYSATITEDNTKKYYYGILKGDIFML